MIDLKKHFISTYTKVLIQDWAVLEKAIDKQTKLIRETVRQSQLDKNTEIASTLITDRQLDDALNGPFQIFFKTHLNAYAAISHVELALTINKSELFKEKDLELTVSLNLPQKLLNQIETLNLKQFRQLLDELTKKQLNQWEEQIAAWSKLLTAALAQNELPLSELEANNLSVNEPVSELNDQFIDLRMELPKLKNEPFNFQQYFQLKTTLAIHAALSRMQKPSTIKDIQNEFEKLRSAFKTIQKEENELLKSQKNAIDELLKPIAFYVDKKK